MLRGFGAKEGGREGEGARGGDAGNSKRMGHSHSLPKWDVTNEKKGKQTSDKGSSELLGSFFQFQLCQM